MFDIPTPYAALRVLVLAGASLGCAAPCVEEARDFNALAAQAEPGKMAILVEFAVGDCEYCEYVEEQVLKPMLRSGEYRDQVLIRKLRFDTEQSVRHFAGHRLSAKAFAQRYNVTVAPTVVLIDARGMPLSNPLVGVSSKDFYTQKLNAAIQEAVSRLHGHAHTAHTETR